MAGDLSGKRVGRYSVGRLLGIGGMGAVYAAVEDGTEREVAIKVMTRNLGEKEEYVRRFEREAKAAAGINCQNVAKVIESGESDDLRYIVMEFIRGESVKTRIEREGQLPIKEAVDYALQTAIGLDAALRAGSIHRDIKPENLMVTPDGVVKIVDFGLARREGADADSFKTATGAVMGTPYYMSPEQATGRELDFRADIYSLGASLYHMLAGRVPFEGSTPFEILQKHITNEVRSIGSLRGDVPHAVEQLVYRMMAKHPDERFQTYGHLIQMLEDALTGKTMPSMTMEVVDDFALAGRRVAERQARRKQLYWVVGGAFALLIFSMGVAISRMNKAEDDSDISLGEAAREVRKTAGETHERYKTQTIPLVREIGEYMEEQDESERNFSRRERNNRDADDE